MLVPAGVALAGLVAFAVAAAHSGTGGCTTPPPEVNLPATLRTLGDFDQPYDVADTPTLQSAALRAATALHSDLAGATPATPIAVAASGPADHDALLVPLVEISSAPGAPQRVAGLVAFLRDCSGRAWYDDTDDLLRTDPGLLPPEFPVVGAAQASASLGTDTPRLVWRTSPFQPLWLDPGSGRTLNAGLPR